MQKKSFKSLCDAKLLAETNKFGHTSTSTSHLGRRQHRQRLQQEIDRHQRDLGRKVGQALM